MMFSVGFQQNSKTLKADVIDVVVVGPNYNPLTVWQANNDNSLTHGWCGRA